MVYDNMKVGTRLKAGFGLVLSLLLLAASFGLWSISTINAKVGEVVEVSVVKWQGESGARSLASDLVWRGDA